MNPDRYWTTGDELTLIQHLGTHQEQSLKIPRLTWLQNYLSVMTTLREEWWTINKDEAMKCVTAEIRAEQRKASREGRRPWHDNKNAGGSGSANSAIGKAIISSCQMDGI